MTDIKSDLQAQLRQAPELESNMETEDEKVVGNIPHALTEALALSIARVGQGLRLYDRNNDLLTQLWARLWDDWKAITTFDEELRYDIYKDHFKYCDEVAFFQDRQENMAVRLYRDGVRSLTFLPELEEAEMRKLVSIFELTEDQWQRQADLVDRLWLLDLQTIKYSAIDGFDQFIEETDGEALAKLGRGLSLMTGQVPNAEELWGKTRRTEVYLDEIDELVEDVQSLALMPPDEFWALQLGAVGDVFETFHQVVRFVSGAPVPTIPEAVLGIVIKKMFIEQLRSDNGEMLGRIEASLRAQGYAGQRLNQGWARAAEPEVFAKFLGLEDKGSPRALALWELMRRYMRVAPEKLVEGALAADVDTVAAALVTILHSKVPDPFIFWLPVLDRLTPTVVGEILYSVPKEQLMDGFGKALLGRVWMSEDNAVFAAVADATPTELLPLLRQALLRRIQHEDSAVRVVAARSLRRAEDKGAGIFILNILRRAEPGSIASEELEPLLRALMALGGDRYLGYLAQCLGPMATGEGGFFGRKRAMKAHVNPLGDRPVLKAIAQYGSPRCWELIRKVYGHCTEELKDYIRKLRAEYEGQPKGDPDTYSEPEEVRTRPERSLYTGPQVTPQVAAPVEPSGQRSAYDLSMVNVPINRPGSEPAPGQPYRQPAPSPQRQPAPSSQQQPAPSPQQGRVPQGAHPQPPGAQIRRPQGRPTSPAGQRSVDQLRTGRAPAQGQPPPRPASPGIRPVRPLPNRRGPSKRKD